MLPKEIGIAVHCRNTHSWHPDGKRRNTHSWHPDSKPPQCYDN